MKYTCPSCGYLIFNSAPSSDDICPICFWHDDLSQLRFPEEVGANKVSLLNAQLNFQKYGAVESRLKDYVRNPESNEKRDVEWRPLDINKDNIQVPEMGVDYGSSYPKNRTDLYYWK